MGSAVRFVDAYRARYNVPLAKSLFGTMRQVLMLSLDDPIEVDANGSGWIGGTSLLVGPQSGPLVATMRGSHRGLHVELDPLTTFRLFGVPGSQLVDGVVQLGSVVGDGWSAELMERLAGCDDSDAMVTVVDRALGPLAAEGREPDPLVLWLWSELVASRGRVKIGELVDRSGFSHRHVVARFRRWIGVAPKVASRLLRFEHAARMAVGGWELAEVASRCGYADQSHLTREMVALSGLTPAALAAHSPDGRATWRPTSGG